MLLNDEYLEKITLFWSIVGCCYVFIVFVLTDVSTCQLEQLCFFLMVNSNVFFHYLYQCYMYAQITLLIYKKFEKCWVCI